jgi:hypothetical protein
LKSHPIHRANISRQLGRGEGREVDPGKKIKKKTTKFIINSSIKDDYLYG